MVEVLKFTHRQRRPLEDVDLETVTNTLSAAAREREQQPELTKLLEPFPLLHARYLQLAEEEREHLIDFYQSNKMYFRGNWSGDCIRTLDVRAELETAQLARQIRYTYQLLEFFEFHQQDTPEKALTTHYLRRNPVFRKQYGCRGATLLKSLCKADLNLAELVDLVACVKPEIRQYYDSREKREEQKLIVPAYPHSGI